MATNPKAPNYVPDQERQPVVDKNRLWERVWFDWLRKILEVAQTAVTSIGDLTLNRLVVGAGTSSIKVISSLDGEVPIGAADGTVQAETLTQGAGVTITNGPHSITIAASAGGIGGADKDVQFNDGGVFGGDSKFTFDKGVGQVAITADVAASQLVVQNATPNTGVLGVNPRTVTYEDITLGAKLNTSSDYIPSGTAFSYLWRDTNTTGLEIDDHLTPGVAAPFSSGVGIGIGGTQATDPASLEAYAYGLATGAIPGVTILSQRNASGSGAAGTIGGQLLDGRYFVIWVDATGAPRYNVGATLAAIRPTESGSVSDTSGTLFGSGGGTTTQIINQLFTRRGEEGRSGIPGLPGPPGATGATGATGPIGQPGPIVGRRSDDGRNGIPGLPGAQGADGATGATGPAGTPGPIISRRSDDGRNGTPGLQGPQGATGATGATGPAGTGGNVLLATVTASNQASVEFTAFSSTYDNYLITFFGHLPITNAASLEITISDAGGYFSSNYQWQEIVSISSGSPAGGGTGAGTGSSIEVFTSCSNANAQSGFIYVFGVNQTSGYIMLRGDVVGYNNTNAHVISTMTGVHALTQAATKLKFTETSGNVSAGTFRLYGIPQ